MDLIQYMGPSDIVHNLKGFGDLENCLTEGQPDPGYWCPLGDTVQPAHLQLEQDAPEALVPAVPDEGVDMPAAASEEERAGKLFPNAFQISGLKHVCDNLCGSVLTGLPQLLASTS